MINQKIMVIQMSIVLLILGSLVYLLEKSEYYVKLQLSGENYYINQSSFDLILEKIEKLSLAQEIKLKHQIEGDFKEIDQLIEKNINHYLDWHYSVRGSVSQSVLMIAAATATVIGDKLVQSDPNQMNALEKEIEKHLFNQELKDHYQKIVQKLDHYQSNISGDIEGLLIKEVKNQNNQIMGAIVHSLNDLKNQKTIILSQLSQQIKERALKTSLKKFKLSLGLSIGALAYVYQKLLVQISERLVISLAQRFAIKNAVKVGVGTTAGSVTAGLFCGPLAVACGIAIGVGVFVAGEYLTNQLDQYLNRDDFKKNLVGIFDEIKRDSIDLLLFQLHSFNELLFAKNQNQKSEIRMIDLLFSK